MEQYKSNLSTIEGLRNRVVSNIDEAVNLEEVERMAFSKLNINALSYLMSGAGDEVTLLRNKAYFRKILLYPKVLIDVSRTDTSTSVLGDKVSSPILIAPSAMQRLADQGGELSTAKAAQEAGSLIVLSTIASNSIEEVAKANKDGLRWFQLYVVKDQNKTMELIRQAEKNGFKGLVITVDAPILGSRERDFQVKFRIPKTFTINENLQSQKLSNNEDNSNEESNSEIFDFFKKNISSSLTWDLIKWLKENTTIKVILKGIHRVDDSIKAQEIGVDAIIVSNHGARQLDTVPSCIEMLFAITKALKKIPNNKMEVYVDGGFRRGSDVFKALAMGAKAVFLGRPILWGLAAGGENGVKKVLSLIKNEFALTMKLCGVNKVEEINEDYIRVKDSFAKF